MKIKNRKIHLVDSITADAIPDTEFNSIRKLYKALLNKTLLLHYKDNKYEVRHKSAKDNLFYYCSLPTFTKTMKEDNVSIIAKILNFA